MKLIPRKISFAARRRIIPAFGALMRSLDRPLHEFKYNVHSQNGEDGVVEEMFLRLKIHDGWLVEFGAWDGRHLSNTFRLIERSGNFRAVYIEGDEERYRQLECTAKAFKDRIVPIREFVQPEGDRSLKNLLESARVPYDFELLSVDVDGIDYQIWAGLTGYAPKVVIVEINSSIPPNTEQIHGAAAQGSSFRSMLNLGRVKGYACVCHIGNMFFVRNDLLPQVRMREAFLLKPESLFSRSWLADS